MFLQEEWYEHIIDAMNDRPVQIGNGKWTRNTLSELTEGKKSFGTKSVVFVEALLKYIKEYNPNKYNSVIDGLWATIDYYEQRGKSQRSIKNYLNSL